MGRTKPRTPAVKHAPSPDPSSVRAPVSPLPSNVVADPSSVVAGPSLPSLASSESIAPTDEVGRSSSSSVVDPFVEGPSAEERIDIERLARSAGLAVEDGPTELLDTFS